MPANESVGRLTFSTFMGVTVWDMLLCSVACKLRSDAAMTASTPSVAKGQSVIGHWITGILTFADLH